MWLLTAAQATSRIEVGTAVYQVPLRPAVDLAQQLLTMRALTGNRFTAGVAPGRPRRATPPWARLRAALQALPRPHGHDQGAGQRRERGPAPTPPRPWRRGRRSPAAPGSCSAPGTAGRTWPGRPATTTAGCARPGPPQDHRRGHQALPRPGRRPGDRGHLPVDLTADSGPLTTTAVQPALRPGRGRRPARLARSARLRRRAAEHPRPEDARRPVRGRHQPRAASRIRSLIPRTPARARSRRRPAPAADHGTPSTEHGTTGSSA